MVGQSSVCIEGSLKSARPAVGSVRLGRVPGPIVATNPKSEEVPGTNARIQMLKL